MSLTTLTYIKSYLNILTTEYDTPLGMFKDSAEEEVKRYCNSALELNTSEYYFIGNNYVLKTLPDTPVISLNTLEYRNNFSDTFTAITSTEYGMVTIDGVCYLQHNSGFNGDVQYRVNYTSGYATIPQPIQQVVIEKTAVMFKESNLNDTRLGIGVAVSNINGVSSNITYKDLFDNHKRILKPYRKIVL